MPPFTGYFETATLETCSPPLSGHQRERRLELSLSLTPLPPSSLCPGLPALPQLPGLTQAWGRRAHPAHLVLVLDALGDSWPPAGGAAGGLPEREAHRRRSGDLMQSGRGEALWGVRMGAREGTQCAQARGQCPERGTEQHGGGGSAGASWLTSPCRSQKQRGDSLGRVRGIFAFTHVISVV